MSKEGYIILGAILTMLLGSVYVVASGEFQLGGDPRNTDTATSSVSTSAVATSTNESEQETEGDMPPAEITLATTTVLLGDVQVSFQLAEPFELAVAAEGLGKARFMAMSPDGRLFVPDMVDYKLSHEGKIYILEDFNQDTKRFEATSTYMTNLRGANSVAFYTDDTGQDWIYIALTEHLIRYPYEAGDTSPGGEGEVVVEFPNTQSPEAKSVVWHITRTVEFKDDKLYISIGSGCNSCEHFEDEMRGMIVRMDPDGSNMEVVAEGLRNAVGMTWAGDVLYATENGSDHLGWDAPDEVMYEIVEGEHYGWPYCYETDGEIQEDNWREWQEPLDCSTIPKSFAYFEPHAAALGLEYFENAHPVLNNTFLVALHGSFEPEIGAGYRIVRVTQDGEQEVFMDGFQKEDFTRTARPLDFYQVDESAFFFTDDHAGRLFYVYAKDE